MPDDESHPPQGPAGPSGPANPYGGPSPFGEPGGYGPSPYRPPPAHDQPNPYAGSNPYGAPSPYGPQHGAGYQPPASKAMAGWALGLTLFFCVPILTAVVGIVLAILALRRGRDGRDHGKGLAIGALVVGPLVVLAWTGFFGLVAIGATIDDDSATRDSDGEVVDGGSVATIRLQVGDCFDDPQLTGAEVEEDATTESVGVVPCAEPHSLEVYDEIELPDGEYPGESEVGDQALTDCLARFRDFAGISYRNSVLEIYTYTPTQQSWDILDDRTLTCMIGDPEGPVTGTLRDAGR